MKSEKLFILLILGFTLFAFCKGDRRSYGENCNKTNRCDSQSALSCIENKCQCLKSNEMIYDESAKKCLILSGEKCSFTLIDGAENRVTETFDCVKNAICDNEYCSCMSGYYEGTEGICREKGTNGENCTEDAQCRSDLMLTCNDGFCLCHQSEAMFNGLKCVAKAGFSCMKYGECVPNAVCGYDQDRLMCTCVNGFKESKNNLCLGTYGFQCDANSSPCTQQLSCIDGKCSCHYPQHQNYDSSTDQCKSLAQGPCYENVTGSLLRFPCGQNAECTTQDGISECVCSDGYINSYDRKCYIAHGQPCVRSESCDPASELMCKNGRCACRDFHIYDERRSLCIGLVGAQCDLRLGDDFCVAGSSCQSYRLDSSDWSKMKQLDRMRNEVFGICRCSQFFVSNSERKCVLTSPIANDTTFFANL